MLPQTFIDEIKDKVPILELIGEYVRLTKSSENIYTGRCPHPDHKDSTASFRVWVAEKSWACMGCHHGKKNSKDKVFGSDCIAFIQWIENIDFIKAVYYLAEKYDIDYPDDEYVGILKYNNMLNKCYVCNLKCKPLQYLYDRGLSKTDIKNYGIGYDGKKITFPLYDKYRNILAYTRRWLVEPEFCDDKYRNSSTNKVFNKKKYFYNIHNIDDDFEEIRITEGPLDAILATKYKAKNIVATLGTAFTEEHVKFFKKNKKIPVFIFDGDEAGKKAIKRASGMLEEEGLYCKILILPDNLDLADFALLKKYELEDYIQKNSITYGMYIMNNLLASYLSSMIQIQLKYKPLLEKTLNQVPYEEKETIKNFILDKFNVEF